MITISENASASLNAVVDTSSSIAAVPGNPVAERGAADLTVQSNSDIMQSTDNSSLLPFSRTGDHSTESGTLVRPVAETQTEMSRTALCRAEGDIITINTTKTWKSVVSVIKLVMDAVSPIAAVCPPNIVFAHASLS
jgi:hypothetical protein